MAKTSASKIASLEMDRKCIELRKAGFSYRQIGQQLDLDPSNAYRRVRRVLQKEIDSMSETTEQYRHLELLRLETIGAKIYQQAVNGDLQAIDRYIALSGRRARMLGVDAPQKVEGDFNVSWADILKRVESNDDAK